jgi:hypothetical protein
LEYVGSELEGLPFDRELSPKRHRSSRARCRDAKLHEFVTTSQPKRRPLLVASSPSGIPEASKQALEAARAEVDFENRDRETGARIVTGNRIRIELESNRN